MKLHLGVIDVPEPEGGTTYSVAQELEETYGLFSIFAEYELDNAAFALEQSVSNALENVMTTGNIPKDIFAEAMGEIENDFQQFLDNSTIEKMGVKGVPTKAALEGRSIRFKRGSAKSWVKGKKSKFLRVEGPRRPSFIDSGVLQASFKSWVEL